MLVTTYYSAFPGYPRWLRLIWFEDSNITWYEYRNNGLERVCAEWSPACCRDGFYCRICNTFVCLEHEAKVESYCRDCSYEIEWINQVE